MIVKWVGDIGMEMATGNERCGMAITMEIITSTTAIVHKRNIIIKRRRIMGRVRGKGDVIS